jgi:iron complex outermembrane receptor protein
MALTVSPALAQSDDSRGQGDTDIVVTATRYARPLSQTPVAVTVLTGAELQAAGIVSFPRVDEQVLGLSIDRTSALQITLRGVTSNDGSEKGDPSVGLLLDGIYLARPQQADISLLDIDRVEVLRGPQGTRFGRNTPGGVVNIISNRPDYRAASAGGEAGYASRQTADVSAFVNLPLASGTAFRLAASFEREDSPARNGPQGGFALDPYRQARALRATLRQRLGERGEALLRFSWALVDGTRENAVPTSNFFRQTAAHTPILDATGNAIRAPISGNVDRLMARDLTPLPIPTEQFGFGANGHTTPWIEDTSWGVDGEVNRDFGVLQAQYLGSYRRFIARENAEVDIYAYASGRPIPGLGKLNQGCPVGQFCSFPGAFDGTYWQTSQELRLTTPTESSVQLTGGVYYFHEESRTALYVVGLPWFLIGYPNLLYGLLADTAASSIAGYGEIAYNLTDHLRLTAGLRYTADDKSRVGNNARLTSTSEPISAPFNASANDAALSSHNTSWRVGFDADMARGLVYASVASGYKQGGFGDGCSTGTTTRVTTNGERCDAALNDPQAVYYRPETLTAFELGYRAGISRALHVDVAGFYYDYRNMQLLSLQIINGAPQEVITNAGRAHIWGVEADARIQPARNHQFSFGVALTDAHYAHFCPNGTTTGDPNGPCLPGTVEFAGRKLDRTPAQDIRASYQLTMPIADGASVTGTIATRMKSRYALTDFNGVPVQYFIPAHTCTDLNVTYRSRSGAFQIAAYAKNLENFVEIQSISANDAVPGDARSFGVRARILF